MKRAVHWAHAACWAAQTLATAHYACTGTRSAAAVLGSVCAADAIRLAVAFFYGTKLVPVTASVAVAGGCAAACGALSYAALSGVGVASYLPLLSSHVAWDALVLCPSPWPTDGRRRAFAIACAVAAVVCSFGSGSSLGTACVLTQALLFSASCALEGSDGGEAVDGAGASACTLWAAMLMFVGCVVGAGPEAVHMDRPPAASMLAAVVMAAASGVLRGIIASAEEHAPPSAVLAAFEGALLLVGAHYMLRQNIGYRDVASNVFAVLALV